MNEQIEKLQEIIEAKKDLITGLELKIETLEKEIEIYADICKKNDDIIDKLEQTLSVKSQVNNINKHNQIALMQENEKLRTELRQMKLWPFNRMEVDIAF